MTKGFLDYCHDARRIVSILHPTLESILGKRSNDGSWPDLGDLKWRITFLRELCRTIREMQELAPKLKPDELASVEASFAYRDEVLADAERELAHYRETLKPQTRTSVLQ